MVENMRLGTNVNTSLNSSRPEILGRGTPGGRRYGDIDTLGELRLPTEPSLTSKPLKRARIII